MDQQITADKVACTNVYPSLLSLDRYGGSKLVSNVSPLETVLSARSTSKIRVMGAYHKQQRADEIQDSESNMDGKFKYAYNVADLTNFAKKSSSCIVYMIEQKRSNTGLQINSECMKFLQDTYNVTPFLSRLIREFRHRWAISSGESWAGGFLSASHTETSGQINCLPKQELWYLVNFVQPGSKALHVDDAEDFGWSIRRLGIYHQSQQHGPDMWLCIVHSNLVPWFTNCANKICSPSQSAGFPWSTDPAYTCPLAGLSMHIKVVRDLTATWKELYDDLSVKYYNTRNDIASYPVSLVADKCWVSYEENLESIRITSLSEHLSLSAVQSLDANLRMFDPLKEKILTDAKSYDHHQHEFWNANKDLKQLLQDTEEFKRLFQVLVKRFKLLGRILRSHQSFDNAEISRIQMLNLLERAEENNELMRQLVDAVGLTNRTQQVMLAFAPATLLTGFFGSQFINSDWIAGAHGKVLRVTFASEAWTIGVPFIIIVIAMATAAIYFFDKSKVVAARSEKTEERQSTSQRRTQTQHSPPESPC